MYNRSLIDYLPEFLRDVEENKAILTLAEQPEVKMTWDALKNVMNDQFVIDATENGISRWEKMLKIIPKNEETLEERKFTILTRINEQLPFTMTTLKSQLNSLCGVNNSEVSLNGFTLLVKVALSAKNSFNDVTSLLKRIVPANMVVEVTLKYTQHDALAKYTHKELSAYTHEQLRNEVFTNGN